jgi:cytochrome c-type biogenesis protein
MWLEAFSLGSAAILTNACVLPLYPGLIAFMASNTGRRGSAWLGVLVLLGVLTMMLIIGLALSLLQQSFGSLLPTLLPIIYALVIFMGILLLLDRSPFARLATAKVPVLRSPFATAYAYGLLLGPMTLPCTGPIITSAFVLGASDSRLLVDGLVYFLFFGLGFGWLLVLLPLIALPVQRRLVGWLARNQRILNRASGILLVAVGVFGILTELVPNYDPQFEVEQGTWVVYWLAVAGLIALVAAVSMRNANNA